METAGASVAVVVVVEEAVCWKALCVEVGSLTPVKSCLAEQVMVRGTCFEEEGSACLCLLCQQGDFSCVVKERGNVSLVAESPCVWEGGIWRFCAWVLGKEMLCVLGAGMLTLFA